MLFFGDNLHETCPYLDQYDNSEFSETFTKPGCKAELGCKGPSTYADCAKRRWNNGINWCVENAVCIGCVEPDFPDGKSPFYVAE
jgi:hydrogenase small subunit